jgi:hypothetical protein
MSVDIAGKSVEELRVLNWRRMLRRRDIPEYEAWKHMKRRCNDLNGAHYHYYGGRGISVWPEWNNDFWAWLGHIGRRPIDGLTQERIDNSKGYEPGNVRWDTQRAQNENRRPPIWRGKTSRYQGVSWDARDNNWVASMRVNGGRQMWLGRFSNETEAAICWNYHCAYYGLDKPLNEIRAEDYIHD